MGAADLAHGFFRNDQEEKIKNTELVEFTREPLQLSTLPGQSKL